MQRHTKQEGFALIMLVGISVVLAILAASLVVVLGNQQGATHRESNTKNSLYYAEAALDSAVASVKNSANFNSGFWTAAGLNANYASLPAPAPTAVSYRVYDNAATLVLHTPAQAGDTPAYDANLDGKVWVEVTTTYQGRTTRLRELVAVYTTSVVSKFPKAALFDGGDAGTSKGNITINGGDIYAVNSDLSAYTGGAPYPSTIMAGGKITATSATNLAGPGSTKQSVGVQADGTVSLPGVLPSGSNGYPITGGVGTLNSYFNTSDQAKLATASKACLTPTVQAEFDAAGTVVNTTLLNTLQGTSSQTYTTATDLVVNGNLTLKAKSGAASTFNFRSLYVTGDLTLTGNVTVNATAVHVGGDFTISGATTAGLTDQFGPVYVTGDANWGGTASVKTTDYTDTNAVPAPMWIGGVYTRGGGAFNDVYGNVFVVFQVNFTPSSGTSSLLCPLLATTEMITTSGNISFGTLAKPMVLYMVCDNDNLWTQTAQWKSVGQFTGLMIYMEAGVNLAPASASSSPSVLGAVMTIGGDGGMTIGANALVAYDQDVIDAICGTITTTTTTVKAVTGTWEQLPTN
jgi:type II secretory pathway pseudopilin PulG